MMVQADVHLPKLLPFWCGVLLFLVPGPILGQEGQVDGKPAGQKPKAVTSPAKIHEVLNRKIVVDYSGQTLMEVLNHLRDKTGVRFVIDRGSPYRYANRGMAFPQPGGIPGGPAIGGGGFQGRTVFTMVINDEPLGIGLKKYLDKFNLSYAVLSDYVFVTTEDQALVRQLKQTVDVEAKEMTLAKALDRLSESTGIRVLLDPTITDSGKKITLNIKDVPAETAARLVAFAGGYKAVRLGNLFVVTTADRAKNLPEETPLPALNNQGIYPPDVDETQVAPGFPPGVIPPGGFGGAGGGFAPGAPGIAPQPAPAPDRPVEGPVEAVPAVEVIPAAEVVPPQAVPERP